MHPLAQGSLGQVEVLGDLGDAAVADAAKAGGLSLEGGRERASEPLLPDGFCVLVHGALLASILAKRGLHEIEAGSSLYICSGGGVVTGNVANLVPRSTRWLRALSGLDRRL